MTRDEAQREIFHAIVECELEDPRGNAYPPISAIEIAKQFGVALFNALSAKGLLKLDDDKK